MNGRIRVFLVFASACCMVGALTVLAGPPEGETDDGAPPPCGFKDAQRTVTNTETGVIIQVTSENPEVVEAIQAFHADFPKGCGKGHGAGRAERGLCGIEGATHTVTNTDNGVSIEISSDDPAVVETIQARAAQGPGMGHGRGPGPGGWGPCMVEGAERTVTNTENGVTVQITSDDPDVVAKIQDRAADVQDRPMADRGPRPDRKARGEGRGMGRGEGRGKGRGHGRGPGGPGQGWGRGGPPHEGFGPIEGAQRTVTQTDNGVIIEITSDDPAVVEIIQQRWADPPQKPGKPGKRGNRGR